MFILTSDLNGFVPSKQNSKISDEVSKQLIENAEKSFANNVSKKHKVRRGFSEYDIKSAAEYVGEDKFIEALDFLRENILFSLGILDKNNKMSISRKKKVSSIIDEL